jgi:putative ABC transport system permease protein
MEFMGGLRQDIRFGLRMLRKNPAFTLAVVLTLALGIGANTAIFSVVDAVLFRPLPLKDPGRLVTVWTHPQDHPEERTPVSLPDFQDYERHSRSLEDLAVYVSNMFLVAGTEGPDYVRGVYVSPAFFRLLGVRPIAGRTLGEADEREWTVILSHRLWMRRYHGDPGAVGKVLELNGHLHTIVGVMPASFRFPGPDMDLWSGFAPIHRVSGNATVGDWITNRSMRGYRVVARLADGIPIEQAGAELGSLALRLARDYPDSNADVRVALVPLQAQMVGPVRPALLTLLGAVGFVLLIACVNVANLLLARTAARGREIAVRLALGASRTRLVRQVLTESLLFALLGGGMGLLLSFWVVDALLRLSPGDIPLLEGVGVNGRVLAFTLTASLLSGILSALAPILQARRGEPACSLHDAGRSATESLPRRRLGGVLIACEVALALVLLVGSGLMIRSFTSLSRVDPGFDPGRLLTMNLPLVVERYSRPEQQVNFFREVLERIESLPGVVAAGASTSLPPNMIQRSDGYIVEGEPAPVPGRIRTALYMPATPHYHRALGIPLLAGRPFAASDSADSAPVAIVNQALARSAFSGIDPVGRRLTVGGVTRTVVGVVGDAKYQGLDAPSGEQIFVPYAQSPFPGMRLVVRTAGEPSEMIEAVRRAAASVDSGQGPTGLRPMSEVLSGSIARPRFYAVLMTVFGALALSLAALGVYGVVAHSVSGRTREIGIRVALGAQPRDVMRQVLLETLVPIAVGVALGVAGAWSLARAISGLLYGITPGDPATLTATVLLLLGISVLATFLPARRASKVDPVTVLRSE